ncbi:MAG: CopG family transcriptional regulator [Chloroflexi bacterium]|nr:CopG family transcriptional regulator [Chloroflexota bacterium]
MEKQNVTLALSKKVLRKAKILAIKKNTSLSGLLTQTLEELVSREENYKRAKQRSFEMLNHGFNFGTKGKINWKREDLHER